MSAARSKLRRIYTRQAIVTAKREWAHNDPMESLAQSLQILNALQSRSAARARQEQEKAPRNFLPLASNF